MTTHLVFRSKSRSILSAAIVACGLLFPAAASRASDHIDGPQLAHDHATDLNDTFAFLDPNDNTKLVMIMTTNPFLISSEAIGQAILDHNTRYRFEIENTGDATPDLFVDVTFTRGVGRLQQQTATVRFGGIKSRRTDPTFTAGTTVALQDNVPAEPVVTTDPASGISVFAGIADDPFFLDNTAANRWVVSSIMNPGNPDDSVFTQRIGADGVGRDTYAGFNTLAVAVSIPLASIRGSAGDMIGVNSVTQRQSQQRVLKNGQVQGKGSKWYNLDRDGNPLVNNGLISADRKDEYNSAPTSDDAKGRFEQTLRTSLANLGTNAQFTETLLTAIQKNGDILRVNTAIANTGPGGGNNAEARYPVSRRPGDDVVDIVFSLIRNGTPITDGVDGPENPFLDTFPFLGRQILPNPQGVDNVDDGTRL